MGRWEKLKLRSSVLYTWPHCSIAPLLMSMVRFSPPIIIQIFDVMYFTRPSSLWLFSHRRERKAGIRLYIGNLQFMVYMRKHFVYFFTQVQVKWQSCDSDEVESLSPQRNMNASIKMHTIWGVAIYLSPRALFSAFFTCLNNLLNLNTPGRYHWK